MRKPVLLGLAMMLALLPGAAASAIPTPDPANPTVTIAPVLPLEATPADRDNQQALRRKAGWSEHFQCRDYPADKDLRQADLVPTGNVSFQIALDPETDDYAVVTVDPRIDDISVYRDTNRVKLGDKPWETQSRVTYSWTLPENVKFYGTFLLWDRNGKTTWRSLDPTVEPEVDGVYKMTLTREGRHKLPSVLFVATDKATCEQRNKIPAELWSSIGLNPPAE